jgi:hypothetical protein
MQAGVCGSVRLHTVLVAFQLPAASSSTKPKAGGGWQRVAASSRRSPGMGKVSAAKGFQLVVKAQVAAKHERETARQMQDHDEVMQREKMREAANEASTWFEHPCFAHLERLFVRRPIIALLALAPFLSTGHGGGWAWAAARTTPPTSSPSRARSR